MSDEGIPLISPVMRKVQNFGVWYEEKKKAQHVGVRMALAAVPGAFQGGMLGSVTHYLTKMSASPSAMAKMSPEQRATLEQTANKTLSEVIPALGAGAAYGVAQGTPAQAPIMAVGFAGFSALFYKLGWGVEKADPAMPAGMTVKQWKDSQYQASSVMLNSLGLQKYHNNVKGGLLTDNTIMLWNDAVLQECKIPPGPRLLILHHIHTVSKSQPAKPRDPVLSPSHPLEIEGKKEKGVRR